MARRYFNDGQRNNMVVSIPLEYVPLGTLFRIYSLQKATFIGKGRNVMHRVIRKMCDGEEVNEQELRNGGQSRKVPGVRVRIAWRLSWEWGIWMGEIARQLGVSTSGIANAIRVVQGKAKIE